MEKYGLLEKFSREKKDMKYYQYIKFHIIGQTVKNDYEWNA